MNKLTLLVLLALPACVSQEQLAQGRARTLAYAEGVCQDRGLTPGSAEYLKCVRKIGQDHEYNLVADGQQLAFVVPSPAPDTGPPRTFYPEPYIPPIYNYR